MKGTYSTVCQGRARSREAGRVSCFPERGVFFVHTRPPCLQYCIHTQHTQTQTQTRRHTHADTHTHTHTRTTHTHIHTHTLSLSLSLSVSLSHTHTTALSISICLSQTQTHFIHAWCVMRAGRIRGRQVQRFGVWKADISLPGKGNFNSHGARPVN